MVFPFENVLVFQLLVSGADLGGGAGGAYPPEMKWFIGVLKRRARDECTPSLPADVLWGSFVTHSFLPHGPWGRNETEVNVK